MLYCISIINVNWFVSVQDKQHKDYNVVIKSQIH